MEWEKGGRDKRNSGRRGDRRVRKETGKRGRDKERSEGEETVGGKMKRAE